VAVGVIGSAITLFEDGHIERAAHLLASLRRSAVDASDEERLAEIDDVVAQMQAHLSGEERESFDAVLSSGSLPAAAETVTGKPFDPLKWATRLVLLALSLTIALDLIAVISDADYHSLIERISNGDAPLEQVQAADDRQSTINVVEVVLFILTAIVFIFWFFRAYRNLTRLGIQDLRWGKNWAIGAWFVPLLNFVRPKSIANDIWRGSDPGLPARAGLPSVGVPWYHSAWWLVFIGGGIFSRIAYQQFRDADTLSGLSSASVALEVSDSLDILAAALAIAVVYQTVKRQRRRARALADYAAQSGSDAVPAPTTAAG
jgi:hypothetical protein